MHRKAHLPRQLAITTAAPVQARPVHWYSFGDNGSSERALGSIGSNGTGDIAYGVRFKNDTATTQTGITISYRGEQWRVANDSVQTLAFSYRIGESLTDADAGNSAYWIPFPALDFNGPNTSPTSSLDGNATANHTVFNNVELNSVVVPPGEELFLRWFDSNDSGSDDGLAIDDLSVSFGAGDTNAPPPAYTNHAFSVLTYNTHGNDVADWSTNSAQVRAIGRQLIYLNPDIVAFNEIPYTNTYQMANWVRVYLPGYFLATNSATDGYIRNAIASRFPITRSKSWLHSSNLAPFGYVGRGFTRDLFEAEIAVPGFPQPLHVFSVHLKSGQDSDSSLKRAAEAGAISNYFVTAYLSTNFLQPYLVCGDMNEDILSPPSSDPQSIQRLVSEPTGLKLTTPLNAYTRSERTFSIQYTSLTKRYDYIMPCSLLAANVESSEVFRTDTLASRPSWLQTYDDKTASDHLPVLMVFNNPYEKPFHLLPLARTNGFVSLGWESVPGQPYTVQTSSNLTTWTATGPSVVATNTMSTFNLTQSASANFFRVQRDVLN